MSRLPRTIVLTGASRGIGFELARILLPKGIKIYGIARNERHIDNAKEKLEPLGDIIFLQADVSFSQTAKKVFEWVNVNWGKLDCLINNAGMQQYHTNFMDEPQDLLEQTMKINLFGPHYFINRLIPLLKKGENPRIINVSSGAGTKEALVSSMDMPSYRLSKYSLNGLTLLYSNALKGKISVNSLDPGWLKTDLGGPNAPGEPIDGAQRIIDLLKIPFEETGKFWKGNNELEL